MSFWALPAWVILSELEEKEALTLGAFPEELASGFVRSLPEHVADLQRGRHIYEVEFDVNGKCAII